jgi:hypothetical protein
MVEIPFGAILLMLMCAGTIVTLLLPILSNVVAPSVQATLGNKLRLDLAEPAKPGMLTLHTLLLVQMS